jgi:hypothetical protein
MFIRELLVKIKQPNIEEHFGQQLQDQLNLLLMLHYAHGKQLKLEFKLHNKELSQPKLLKD